MDYISRAALMGNLTSSEMQQKIKGMTGTEAYTAFLLMVCGVEKADVAPVRRGRWVRTSEYMPIYGCSICASGNLFRKGENVLSNYCPNCGAKMDGGADNGE